MELKNQVDEIRRRISAGSLYDKAKNYEADCGFLLARISDLEKELNELRNCSELISDSVDYRKLTKDLIAVLEENGVVLYSSPTA